MKGMLQGLCEDAQEDYGLLIRIDTNDATCFLDFVPDKHLEEIHPNAYGPAALTSLARLGGGGSGVQVFQGRHPTLGKVVMKHGSFKDTTELFALATIAHELRIRKSLIGGNKDADAMADDLKSRIPEFRMLYLSPKHLRDSPKELWKRVNSALTGIIRHQDHNGNGSDHRRHALASCTQCLVEEEESSHGCNGEPETGCIRLYARTRSSSESEASSSSSSGAQVKLHGSHRLQLIVGPADSVTPIINEDGKQLSVQYGAPLGAYSVLKPLVDELVVLQKERLWKFTQGQKTIGSLSVKTGVYHLANGTLEGDLLDTLIREYIHVIRSLQVLTLPEERDIVETIRQEVNAIDLNPLAKPEDISNDADAFVGFAIKKNWHPVKGRFVISRDIGQAFREGNLFLTPEEALPARLLGVILKQGCLMSDVFVDAPDIPPAMDFKVKGEASLSRWDTWRFILKDAVRLQSNAAVQRIWTCGIADGGLHNMFLSEHKMWLFDMGEPTLQTMPGFLTKFLFSFFHGLGMVDDVNGCGWVNRFIPGDKLELTNETKELVPKAYHAFQVTVERMIVELFDGEQNVLGPLMNYVSLQLISDAAFCLNRWTIKGGGKPRDHNHHKHLEQWLWRALWDIYIASDLHTDEHLRQFRLCPRRGTSGNIRYESMEHVIGFEDDDDDDDDE